MVKVLKSTKCSFSFDFVDTVAIREGAVLLSFHGLNGSAECLLPTQFYNKNFLKNAVNAFAVGCSIEHILDKAEEYSTTKADF